MTMADSVDRVFAHALQTVRKIPRTGSTRPPPDARLKLYGLYKQSMEGDVGGVMERPVLESLEHASEEDRAEVEKWDAWYSQRGLSRTEAKRRYITTLIETMHKYAYGTAEARELVSELEFVWDQIRSNISPTSTAPSSPALRAISPLPPATDNGLSSLPLPTISPHPYTSADDDALPPTDALPDHSPAWRLRVEKALAKMTTEVAALREQLESRRMREARRKSDFAMWVLYLGWAVVRHLIVEAVFWAIVVLWMRKRGDRRAEEAVRVVGRFVREGLRELGFGRRRGVPSAPSTVGSTRG
ncbi:acyl-CoA binding protein [Ascodesmis nigricans]|uniref:Acyl-CoA binding protein n=1 Tax=Ascodesmis nigricans TaxID=341454 RepID=A0A4S2MLA1_9PEZI|nr:acyl-CoA binding protein [Ascodesmis nigricans]